MTTVSGFFMDDVLVTYLEAAGVLRCARQPHSGWHQFCGVEMLMVVLRLLSMCASQVCYLADYSRYSTLYLCGGGDL